MIPQLSAHTTTVVENKSLYGSLEAHLSNSAVHGQLYETKTLLNSSTQTAQWICKENSIDFFAQYPSKFEK